MSPSNSGSIIYEVRSDTGQRINSFGARKSYEEAVELLADSQTRVEAAGGRNIRYWIEEVDTSDLFEMPSRPTPRDKYSIRVTASPRSEGWPQSHVEVLEGDRIVGTYDRNYSMLQTFEPFRQGDRDFALISPNYTATSIMDLATGEIVASEEPSDGGFCPVGFYVPDWWDIQKGTVLPGSMHWNADYEWPFEGNFGFVWGCVWGDDSSWKVQYLDLTEIQTGVIRRDDRFGYVKLATNDKLDVRDFIHCWSYEGHRYVKFSTLQDFALASGDEVDELDV